MARSKLDLINDALVAISAEPLEFEDEAARATFLAGGDIDPYEREQQITGRIYPHVRNRLLNAHTWSWLTTRAALVESPAQPQDNTMAWPYRHRYRLPEQRIGNTHAVFDRAEPDAERAEGWDIMGVHLFADFRPAWIEYQRDVAKEVWPNTFADALVLALAARFAFPIKEDIDTKREFERDAKLALDDAKRINDQGQPVKALPSFGFVDARIGGQIFTRRQGY